MAIRKSWNILDINKLGMFYFYLKAFEQGDNILILLITGDRGFPKAYNVEIRLYSITYIACPTYFEEEFYWRMATDEEAAEIQVYAEMLPDARIYCLEERLPQWIKRPPRKYFLAAASIEITLLYSDELEGLHSWGEEA
ncbi:MAG TPA: hypothetical protein VFA09_21020 [Ktedonobacteraceae bacterium]|nr:hypothetical protein [Ktedonobacteraceae bacterium]